MAKTLTQATTPQGKAVALEQAAAAAKAAGASDAAIAALGEEAAAARKDAADKRPLGDRLNSAAARVKRCEVKAHAAHEAFAAATERASEAQQELDAAQLSLQALEAEVAQAPLVAP